jgi:hypothetical protein
MTERRTNNCNKNECPCGVLGIPSTSGWAKIRECEIAAIVCGGKTYDIHLNSGTIFTVIHAYESGRLPPSDLLKDLVRYYDNMDDGWSTQSMHEGEE